jgi:hypothetical protein
MQTSFKLRNKTARQSGCTLLINPVCTALGWDVVRQYDSKETGLRLGVSEIVIAYDASTLAHQFDITHKKAAELSNLFDSLI